MGHKRKVKPTFENEFTIMEEIEVKTERKKEDQHVLDTVNFLREYYNKHKSSPKRKGVELLADKHKLKFKFHGEHRNLVLIKYDMLKSNMNTKVVQECRGLIVDLEDYFRVVCMPYSKFFNMDELQSSYKRGHFDFSTASVYEKLDGSLCTLYYYKDKWHVSSSGTPDAGGLLNNHNTRLTEQEPIKFCDLFWDIWNKLNYTLPKDTNKCYMFEMLTPRHVILCRPLEEQIILHGVRDIDSLKEERPQEYAVTNNWECIKIYDMFESLNHVKDYSRCLNPIKNEGFVVCDANFNRVKIKSPQYVALSHISFSDHNKVNDRMMLGVIKTNEGSEFLSYFEKYRDLYDTLKGYYDDFVSKMEKIIERNLKGTMLTNVIHETMGHTLKPNALKLVLSFVRSGPLLLTEISRCDNYELYIVIKEIYMKKEGE